VKHTLPTFLTLDRHCSHGRIKCALTLVGGGSGADSHALASAAWHRLHYKNLSFEVNLFTGHNESFFYKPQVSSLGVVALRGTALFSHGI
jgi:hypothetical protein